MVQPRERTTGPSECDALSPDYGETLAGCADVVECALCEAFDELDVPPCEQ